MSELLQSKSKFFWVVTVCTFCKKWSYVTGNKQTNKKRMSRIKSVRRHFNLANHSPSICKLVVFQVGTLDLLLLESTNVSYFLGNYGNQLDVSVPPSASSTSPTNAIFDGCCYYFLPWNDIKPCCHVDSHWEDIAFRLEPLNILSRICDQIVSNQHCMPNGRVQS